MWNLLTLLSLLKLSRLYSRYDLILLYGFNRVSSVYQATRYRDSVFLDPLLWGVTLIASTEIFTVNIQNSSPPSSSLLCFNIASQYTFIHLEYLLLSPQFPLKPLYHHALPLQAFKKPFPNSRGRKTEVELDRESLSSSEVRSQHTSAYPILTFPCSFTV